MHHNRYPKGSTYLQNAQKKKGYQIPIMSTNTLKMAEGNSPLEIAVKFPPKALS